MQKATPENKEYLMPEEAITLFVLSRRKFGEWLRKENSRPIIVKYGKRKLINRVAFEQYLNEHPELRRRD
ncbi:MAG: DNA-binding protein [Oscillospiraceae bacterium]|nr:DNA-binding protein [Oscillospiraceae bacterium]